MYTPALGVVRIVKLSLGLRNLDYTVVIPLEITPSMPPVFRLTLSFMPLSLLNTIAL